MRPRMRLARQDAPLGEDLVPQLTPRDGLPPQVEDEAAAPQTATRTSRWLALDWMRGLVMVLMTLDHASEMFNGGRYAHDSAGRYHAGEAIPAAQFFVRWLTHLCAPTFIFLAGAALAASTEKRRAKGESDRSLDRHLMTRGLILVALEPLWMTWAFFEAPERALQVVLFQVLYAIGGGLLFMVVLRRLRSRVLAILAIALFFGHEALATWLSALFGQSSLPLGALLTGGRFFDRRLIIAYPLLPWLPMMISGWLFGRWLTKPSTLSPERLLGCAGAATLALFVGVRAANGYGNAGLLRYGYGGDVLQWLHVSKYPPSLTYAALELGLMALVLAAFFRLARHARAASWMRPLELLGQTALFYYVLHLHLLFAAAAALGMLHGGGLLAAHVAAIGTVLVLLPVCALYRRYKRRHPDGLTRFL